MERRGMLRTRALEWMHAGLQVLIEGPSGAFHNPVTPTKRAKVQGLGSLVPLLPTFRVVAIQSRPASWQLKRLFQRNALVR
jgi:hypothetical protein